MKKNERRRFIGLLGSAFALVSMDLRGMIFPYSTEFQQDMSGKVLKLKGNPGSGVIRWDVITIGNLSRNRYWGESDEKPLRSAICTCTVISGKNFHILVDPSLKDKDSMAAELDRRTGLTIGEIDTVFITHRHDDHLFGIRHFMNASWIAGPEVAKALNESNLYSKRFEPADARLMGTIDVIHTPGHTYDHYSLRFDCDGFSVLVAGDAVATKDYWEERRMYYNVADMEQSRITMEKINMISDIIVPGHDNYFIIS